MSRNILKSNNSLVIAGARSPFETGNIGSSDESIGAYMSAVQGVSIGFSQQRDKLKQIGSKGLVINDINRMPDVDLNISYYYTPAMLNENLLGLCAANPSYNGTGFFDGYSNLDQNFYIINHQDQGSDMISYGSENNQVVNVNNIDEVFSIGNAFLTNYSLSFSIGSLPVVSTSYKCSNVVFHQGTLSSNEGGQSSMENPAINLASGNHDYTGYIDLQFTDTTGYDYYNQINRFNPPLCSPQNLNITLQNLQIGGTPISGFSAVQSLSFDIPIRRVDLFGLGSDYPYSRKVQYPLTSSLNVEFLVSGFNVGEMYDLIDNESSYNFDIQIIDTGEEYQNTFSFDGLKLETASYQMNLNDQMTYSLGFSFEITN